MIEPAKFIYSPFGKAFEKQTKTIKDQGEKQADVLKALKTKEAFKPKELKPILYDNYFINGQREIRNSTKPTDFNNLIYNFKGPNNAPINFIELKDPLHIFKSIHNGDKTLEDVENEHIKLISNLGRINQEPLQYKSPEQLNTIENITNPYESREKVIQLFNKYVKNV